VPRAGSPKLGRDREWVGDFELCYRLGFGGMAELFAARRRGSREVVALKRILPALAGDQVFVDMFLDEARIAATLDHPNIVRVHETGSAGGQHYMVMELLAGRDLASVIRALRDAGRRPPAAAAIRIIGDAAAGLHHAHEMADAAGEPLRIIHRDMSPRNVFLTAGGTVKILDFGIAKARDRLSITRTGTVKGKFPYMSPEAIRDEALDRRTDVFSLGVLLWELTCGQRLFSGGTDYEILRRVLNRPIPRPSQVVPDYPVELEAVVMRALAKQRDRRTPTAAALAAELDQVGGRPAAGAVADLMMELFPGVVVDPVAESGSQPVTRADRPPASATLRRGRIGRLVDALRRRPPGA
jgi:eukaryotic-like serine/threonine-protein kinase